MAKKVRQRPEEAKESAFEFPEFDERKFVTKEFELTGALVLASLIALVLGAVSWLATSAHLPWYVPFPVGILVLALCPTLIGRLRTRSDLYTTSDWAGLLALVFFGWIAVWFVLVDVIA
jgi:uncharacterized membrane protein